MRVNFAQLQIQLHPRHYDAVPDRIRIDILSGIEYFRGNMKWARVVCKIKC